MESAHMAIETNATITVNFPADLFQEIQRIAAEEGWPPSKAVILLAKLGAKAQKQAEQSLHSTYQAFMSETDPQTLDKRGDDMTRAIFGPEAIG
jgi:hypothetical protein